MDAKTIVAVVLVAFIIGGFIFLQIPKNIPLNQTEDYVCKALEHYASYLRKRAERDAR